MNKGLKEVQAIVMVGKEAQQLNFLAHDYDFTFSGPMLWMRVDSGEYVYLNKSMVVQLTVRDVLDQTQE